MKTLIFLLVYVFLSINLFSQTDYCKYDNSYEEKTYKITLNIFKNNTYSVNIYAQPIDRLIDNGGFEISQNQLDGFLSNLNFAKQKYIEWDSIARVNNVSEISKKIDLKSQKIRGYFYFGNSWDLDYYVLPNFEYRIIPSEDSTSHKRLLIVRTGELQSSTNEFTKCDGFALVFTSVEEITNFINLISKDKIDSFILKNPNKEDLFK